MSFIAVYIFAVIYLFLLLFFQFIISYLLFTYFQDLGRLGRELNKSIIVDNSPASYIFHPENAVPVVSWFDDMENRELLELIPFFEELSTADNIYSLLQRIQARDPNSQPPPTQQRV